ncbi:hypothetical protein SAMN04489724_1119 [Algoriphagus locisalis]|uniref:Uncharacterized protein n=1 Tax=Algoriphagus locisalis TaxID=305507 RepID=A0A1I6YNC7_9BACT|nr:hypothetical protein [Algoriphagus locisalis]SFT51925.1 hypothetical protein SAMN04489724_1119 [Algoriphagus locisalis]
MSALPKRQLSFFEQGVGLATGFSKILVNQQEIIKIFNQKSGMVMQGMCKFEENSEVLYPLFKGLSEAGKPKSLNLRFTSAERAAYFYYPESSQAEVSKFFSELILLLQKEVKFKKVLKEVIINRNQFRSEQFLLQNAMMD